MATPGEIAATGAIAIRIAQMTGWVSFTLMAVYANIGEIEDGMRTLTPPHTADRPARCGALARFKRAHRLSRT
jgi:ATP-binding cassette subfamily B protein